MPFMDFTVIYAAKERNMHRSKNMYNEMNIQAKGFRQLKPIIRKTGTKVVIVGRFGLPFFLHKYRKRKMFFAGALLFAVLIFLMSRYIWNIDIRGMPLPDSARHCLGSPPHPYP